MQRVPDPYRVLGVGRDATTAEVKAAHRRLAKRYHPDAPHADAARFLAVQDAYELLRDPLRRRDWDRDHAPGPVRAEPATTRDPPTRDRRPPTSPMASDRPTSPRRRRRRPTGVDATFGPNDRPPQADSWTWTAEGVPWWEDGGGSNVAQGLAPPVGAGGGGPTADRPDRRAGPARPVPPSKARLAPGDRDSGRAVRGRCPDRNRCLRSLERRRLVVGLAGLLPSPRGGHAERRRQPEHAPLDDAGRRTGATPLRDGGLAARRSGARRRRPTCADGARRRDRIEPRPGRRPGRALPSGRRMSDRPLGWPGPPALGRADVDGPAAWGTRVRSSRPGVYLIELPSAPDSAPVDFEAIGRWLDQVPVLTLDGTAADRPRAGGAAASLLAARPAGPLRGHVRRLDRCAARCLRAHAARRPQAARRRLLAQDAQRPRPPAHLVGRDRRARGVPGRPAGRLRRRGPGRGGRDAASTPPSSCPSPTCRRQTAGASSTACAARSTTTRPPGPVTPAQRRRGAVKPAKSPADGVRRSDRVLSAAGARARRALRASRRSTERPEGHRPPTRVTATGLAAMQAEHAPADDRRSAGHRGPHQVGTRAGRPARELRVPGGSPRAVVRRGPRSRRSRSCSGTSRSSRRARRPSRRARLGGRRRRRLRGVDLPDRRADANRTRATAASRRARRSAPPCSVTCRATRSRWSRRPARPATASSASAEAQRSRLASSTMAA